MGLFFAPKSPKSLFACSSVRTKGPLKKKKH
jgi:hypothetical protein